MRLATALAFSLLVHGGAAWLAARRTPPPPVAAKPSTQATRVALFTRATEPVVAAARMEAPARHVRPAARRVDAPVREPIAGSRSVALKPDDAAGSGEATDAPAPAGATSRDTPSGVEGPASGVVSAAPSARPAFDVTALHERLAASAQRCYPPAARRFGLAGEAQLEFCLDARGALCSTKLLRSTGQPLLDAAAQSCVLEGALPFPAEAAGGCYSIPVRFGR